MLDPIRCSVLFFTILTVFSVNCYNFDLTNVMIISNQSVKNKYFSYTLLLQTSDRQSTLIVGAPKNLNNPNSGGDLYICDLNKEETPCTQYPIGRIRDIKITNGNMFGLSLDGSADLHGSFVACAPRYLQPARTQIFLRGYCIYMKNSSAISESPIEIVPFQGENDDIACCDYEKKYFYKYAYALAGIDVSYCSQRNVLIGAPGAMSFNGATVSWFEKSTGYSVLPKRASAIQGESYFGYAVTNAKFQPNSDEIWYVAGAPRANHLKGKVTIYYYDNEMFEKIHIVASLEGEDIGSYFGSVLLASDVSGDKYIDLLVGAPMTSGKTWDEGNVYFYQALSSKSFMKSKILTGLSKMASRFGSAIASLGDIDLDGYNDVAISAPYEDDGIGAVYIYLGSSEGLQDEFSQRLFPGAFNIPGMESRGFGLGLSKGNDVDQNGYNDIAVGAYKTDQIFLFKTLSIIDYRITLTADINSIPSDTKNFTIQLCVIYTERSGKHVLAYVDFNVFLQPDYRSIKGNIDEIVQVPEGKLTCRNFTIELKRTVAMDITPFSINLKLNVARNDIIAHGEKFLNLKIPYSHGCGKDDVCNTQLSVVLKVDKNQIVLGEDKQIHLKVIAMNTGDPAYQCEIKFMLNNALELRNTKNCMNIEASNYTCSISDVLIGSIENEFVFDIRNLSPDMRLLEFMVQVTSLGVNNPKSKDIEAVQIPVVLESVPYLNGKVSPENIEIQENADNPEMEIIYQFSLGKRGPSPLSIDVNILIPLLMHGENYIFEVIDLEAKIENVQMSCSNSHSQVLDNVIQNFSFPINRTILITCDQSTECLQFSCNGEYVYDSRQIGMFKLKILLRSNLLIEKFKETFTTKDIIAFVPVVSQATLEDKIMTYKPFLIFVESNKRIALWIYIFAAILGLVLLILISLALYKCHFFDRIYKDKLERERILNSTRTSIEGECDEIQFLPMENHVKCEQECS